MYDATEALTLEQGRERLAHIVAQIGWVEVMEFLVDRVDNETTCVAGIGREIESILTRHFGPRVD